jgi:hypothetical protein
MERRRRKTKNGHRTYYVRVDTHRYEEDFNFTSWKDESPPATSLLMLEVLKLVRVKISKKIKYSSYARSSLEKQKKVFIKNHHRDAKFDYELTEIIPYGNRFVLCYNEEKGDKSWYTNTCLLAVLDFVVLGWIVRWRFNANTRFVKYKIVKRIEY